MINEPNNPVLIEWRRKDGRLGVGVVTRLDACVLVTKHKAAVQVYAIDDPMLIVQAKKLIGVK